MELRHRRKYQDRRAVFELDTYTYHLNPACFRRKPWRRVIFEVQGSKNSLYLAAEGLLESVKGPGVDHLFMLVSKGSPETYLILRELDGIRNYKLIACPDLFLAESSHTVLKVDS